MDTFTTHSLTYGSEDRTERLQMAEGFGVFCEILSPNNVRSYTLNVSRMRLPKNELKKKKMALIDIPQGKAHKPSDLQKELQEPKG